MSKAILGYTKNEHFFFDKKTSNKMTNREQLIQELEQALDDLVEAVLNFLHQAKTIPKPHPLEKFVGILSDSEAEELKSTIAIECRQIDLNEC
jgi:hypothetical protein